VCERLARDIAPLGHVEAGYVLLAAAASPTADWQVSAMQHTDVSRIHYTTAGLRLTTQPRPHQASDTAKQMPLLVPNSVLVWRPLFSGKAGVPARRARLAAPALRPGARVRHVRSEGSQQLYV
jgi:hypothetical protein